MSKFAVVVLPDVASVAEARRALQALHADGSVTVYGTAVVHRDPAGALVALPPGDQGAPGLGVEALVDALVRWFGGPAGRAPGVGGGWPDYLHAEASDELLELVEQALRPGRSALVAEVAEEWTAPVDARMEALGGTVVREQRDDFIDEVLEKRAEARRAELARRQAARARAQAERWAAQLDRQIDDARVELERAAGDARARLERTRQELEAKLEALAAQAATATPEVRERLARRVAALRDEFAERERKLARASTLAPAPAPP